MTREMLFGFIVFWGVWLLIPVLLDGVIALKHVYFSWRELFRRKKESREMAGLAFYPQVSIVLPVHNSGGTLYQCLKSVAEQKYPLEKVRVFLVDNGSTDDSFKVFTRFSKDYPNVLLRWVKLTEPGKAKALNSGIFLGNSEIFINVDSDTRLEQNALIETVRAFNDDPAIAGATGAVLIDYEEISKDSVFLRLLQSCELFEYLEAFFIGRKYEAQHNRLYTLAGAFSCFKRQNLLETYLYDEEAIAEDTKLTFELRKKNKDKKIGFFEKVKIFLEPIPSLKKLYAQRVRWQRGELDVIGSYKEHYQGGVGNLVNSFAARLLFIDHTLIFPRMMWVFLTPLLVFVGYPLELIVLANLFVYIMYIFIDLNYLLVAYFYLDQDYRNYLKSNVWRVIFLPLYRFIVFWFRAAAVIHAVTEPPKWEVGNPLEETLRVIERYKKFTISLFTREDKKISP